MSGEFKGQKGLILYGFLHTDCVSLDPDGAETIELEADECRHLARWLLEQAKRIESGSHFR